MASGGARARSGPAPDPDALRRSRPGDAADWVSLDPAARADADAPEWPLDVPLSGAMARRWVSLWRKPQAVMWDGLEDLVAAYVVAFDESVQPGAAAGLKTAVLRMEAELGVSIVGMRSNRWRIVESVPSDEDDGKVTDIRSRFQRGSAAS